MPPQAVAIAVSVGTSQGFTSKTVIPCWMRFVPIALGDGLLQGGTGPALLELHHRAELLDAAVLLVQVRHETLQILQIPRIALNAFGIEIARVVEFVLGFLLVAGLEKLLQRLRRAGVGYAIFSRFLLRAMSVCRELQRGL